MVWYERERRRKINNWLILARGLAIFGWFLFIVALVVSFYAAPEIEYGIIKYHGLEVRKTWQPQFTTYLFAILWFNALSSIVAISINHFKARRATDNKNHYNLIILLLISIVWGLYVYFDIY